MPVKAPIVKVVNHSVVVQPNSRFKPAKVRNKKNLRWSVSGEEFVERPEHFSDMLATSNAQSAAFGQQLSAGLYQSLLDYDREHGGDKDFGPALSALVGLCKMFGKKPKKCKLKSIQGRLDVVLLNKWLTADEIEAIVRKAIAGEALLDDSLKLEKELNLELEFRHKIAVHLSNFLERVIKEPLSNTQQNYTEDRLREELLKGADTGCYRAIAADFAQFGQILTVIQAKIVLQAKHSQETERGDQLKQVMLDDMIQPLQGLQAVSSTSMHLGLIYQLRDGCWGLYELLKAYQDYFSLDELTHLRSALASERQLLLIKKKLTDPLLELSTALHALLGSVHALCEAKIAAEAAKKEEDCGSISDFLGQDKPGSLSDDGMVVAADAALAPDSAQRSLWRTLKLSPPAWAGLAFLAASGLGAVSAYAAADAAAPPAIVMALGPVGTGFVFALLVLLCMGLCAFGAARYRREQQTEHGLPMSFPEIKPGERVGSGCQTPRNSPAASLKSLAGSAPTTPNHFAVATQRC